MRNHLSGLRFSSSSCERRRTAHQQPELETTLLSLLHQVVTVDLQVTSLDFPSDNLFNKPRR